MKSFWFKLLVTLLRSSIHVSLFYSNWKTFIWDKIKRAVRVRNAFANDAYFTSTGAVSVPVVLVAGSMELVASVLWDSRVPYFILIVSTLSILLLLGVTHQCPVMNWNCSSALDKCWYILYAARNRQQFDRLSLKYIFLSTLFLPLSLLQSLIT